MAISPLTYWLSATSATGLAIVAVVAYYLISYLVSPLKDIPGPFLAKFTNAWRVYDYYHLISPETQKKLHAKHGAAVRLGPSLVALNDPDLIPVIYNSRGTFRKVCISSTPSCSCCTWKQSTPEPHINAEVRSTGRFLLSLRCTGPRHEDGAYLLDS